MSLHSVNGTKTLLGIGLYSLADAARYIHVTPPIVNRWALGRQSRARGNGAATRTPPVFVTPALRVEGETVLTFAHLIELRMVRLFRKYGVSMAVIKAAAQNAARSLQSPHPFSSLRLNTDGKRIFDDISPKDVNLEGENVNESRIVRDLAELQMVMGDIVRIYFRDTDYEDDMASRWWLLGKGSRAVLDPSRAFGQPIDNPTGVPLIVLYNLIKAGETANRVADWYEVPVEAVDSAVDLYTSLKSIR